MYVLLDQSQIAARIFKKFILKNADTPLVPRERANTTNSVRAGRLQEGPTISYTRLYASSFDGEPMMGVVSADASAAIRV
jgi:hypothetical protein